MVIIHAGVERPCELQNAGAICFGEPAWRRTAAGAVGERGGAVLVHPAPAPSDLTRREREEPGSFSTGQDAVKDSGQDLHALVLASIH